MQLKGRVACEINTCDELIATEMVFENVLESLNPPEIAGSPIVAYVVCLHSIELP